MTSKEDIWVAEITLEGGSWTYTYRLSETNHLFNQKGWPDELGKTIKEIEEFDFNQLNNIASKLSIMRQNFRKNISKRLDLMINFRKLFQDFQKLVEKNFYNEITKRFLIIFHSIEEQPQVQNSSEFVEYITKTEIVRNKKTYPIDKNFLSDLFIQNPEYIRELLFIDYDININVLMSAYSSIFQKYMNEKFPLKHKHSTKYVQGECNESKNGILRGLVHMIGYTGYGNLTPEDYLSNIINSQYLEIQFSKRNPDSGIFTTILGKDNSIKELYGERSGIYFIFSLSVLDDFDYWAGKHNLGKRTGTSFYKGICYKCSDKLENYSAAERCYMEMFSEKFEIFYELMFASDINIKRYVEEIYVADKETYNTLLASSKLPNWVKVLLTNKENTKKIYRKNCKGETPNFIDEKEFNKMVKLTMKRKLMKDIPKVDYKAINQRRKIELIYKP